MGKNPDDPIILGYMEKVFEVIQDGSEICGTMILFIRRSQFYLTWFPDETGINNYRKIKNHDYKKKDCDWNPMHEFILKCRVITGFHFHSNPYIINISLICRRTSRTFRIDQNENESISPIISPMICYGVAVPSARWSFSVEMYLESKRDLFPLMPSTFHLRSGTYKTRDELWTDILNLSSKVFQFLYESKCIPKNSSFPLFSAARASHIMTLQKIERETQNYVKFQKITSSEFDTMFDKDGRMINFDLFKDRCYRGGIESDVLPRAIPYILGLYNPNDSFQEISEFNQKLEKQYMSLIKQIELISKTQLDQDDKLSSSFRIIDRDVSRTDRSLNTFKNTSGIGARMLSRLLRAYRIFNPPIGYLQGMNDLMVPIMLLIIPEWDKDGTPIGKDGPIIDTIKEESLIFWLFDSMLSNLNHTPILQNISESFKDLVSRIVERLGNVSPMAELFLKTAELSSLIWCYSDFVLLFKRTLPQIWDYWVFFNSSRYPKRILETFVTAVLITTFDQIATFPDMNITTMMDSFPIIIKSAYLEDLRNVSIWLEESMTEEKQEKEEPQFESEFFTPIL